MREELEPAIFNVNPEYRHWKAEQSGAIFPFSIPAQELPISPLHERRLRNYENQAIPLWEKAVNRWITEKARVAELVPSVFPKGTFIPQLVVKANDRRALEETMFSLFKEDETWLGIRTCYQDWIRGAPWKMGIASKEDIREYLNEDYPRWLEIKSPGGKQVEEIVVLGNPPLLGKPEFEERHFVFMASALPHQIIVEAKLSTSQLRDLEGDTKEFIEITKPLPETCSRTAELPRTIFGDVYWNEETLKRVTTCYVNAISKIQKTFNILAKLKGLSGRELVQSNSEYLSIGGRSLWEWPEEEKTKSEIEGLLEDYHKVIAKQKDASKVVKAIVMRIASPLDVMISVETLQAGIKGRIRDAMLDERFDQEMYRTLISPRARVATGDLENLIFKQWSEPPMDLYLRLVALNNVCVLPGQAPGRGNDTIEVQGAYGQDGKIEYALIQSVRGREEKEFGERAKTQVR